MTEAYSDARPMDPKRETLLLAIANAMIVLISLGSIVWAAAFGLLRDIDGLLLAAIALMCAVVFGIQFLLLARDLGWIGRKSSGDAGKPPEAK